VSRKEQIIQALKSADEEKRLQGLRALAEDHPEQSMDLIFHALGDESWRVRKEAVGLFMHLPLECKEVAAIIELLYAEDNAGLRNAAVEILTRMGRGVVAALVEHSDCSDHDVRKFIVDVLGDIADPAAVPVMIQRLEDEDSNVRAAAAENLGKMKAHEAVPALLEAMRLPDLLLQFTILDALSRIAAPVEFSNLSPYKDEKLLRKAMIDCLGKTGDASSVPLLIESLVDDMRNVREAALLALVALFERYPDAVRSGLTSGDGNAIVKEVIAYLDLEQGDALKLAAVRVLGWLGAEDAVAALLPLLDYESLQQETVASLVEIGRSHPKALLDVWTDASDGRRAYLAYILGEAGCREALPQLKQGIDSADSQLQRMSVYALGRLGAAETLPELVGCLQSSASDVQEAAMQALACFGKSFPEQTFAALQPLLAHEEATLRMLAVMVMRALDHPSVLDSLSLSIKDPSADVRREAVKVFEGGELGKHLSALLLALTDEDAEMRRTVVDILSGSGMEEALDGLQLALKDDDIWVRAAAVRGIGRVAGGKSKELIKGALLDPVGLVSIAALETLGSVLGKEACSDMVSALNHSDQEVVVAAMNLLSSYCSNQWLQDNLEMLLGHPSPNVRSHIARLAGELLGASVRPMLIGWLEIENDDLVAQQIKCALEELP